MTIFSNDGSCIIEFDSKLNPVIVHSGEEVESILITLKNFRWSDHIKNCKKCETFQNTFGKKSFRWILAINPAQIEKGEMLKKKFYLLNRLETFKLHDPTITAELQENYTQWSIGPGTGPKGDTTLNFKVTELGENHVLLHAYLILNADSEKYEACIEIRDTIKCLG
jgi:hypothetical protein